MHAKGDTYKYGSGQVVSCSHFVHATSLIITVLELGTIFILCLKLSKLPVVLCIPEVSVFIFGCCQD